MSGKEDHKRPGFAASTPSFHGTLLPGRELMQMMERYAAVSERLARLFKSICFPTNDLSRINGGLAKFIEESRHVAAMIERLAPRRALFPDLAITKIGLQFSGLEMTKARRALGNINLFQRAMSKELAQLTGSFASFPQSAAYIAFQDQIRGLKAPYFEDLAQRSAEVFHPFGEALTSMHENERIAGVILEFGIVPHGELWTFFAAIDANEEDKVALAVRLAHECWEPLKVAIALETDGCMGDEKLARLFGQMLNAHERGDHEIVRTAMPGALERAMRVAFAPTEPPKIDYWIRKHVGELPLDAIDGLRGFRVWKILVEHSFKGFRDDAHADTIPFPNRHTAAHGGGRQMASVIDSLNALLLTHFVIKLAAAQRYHRDSDAA